MREYTATRYPTYISLKQDILDRVTRDIDDDAKGLNAVGGEKTARQNARDEIRRRQQTPQTRQEQEDQWSQEDWDKWEWGQDWQEWAQAQEPGINGIKGKGKGDKGKGKGVFHGKCYNCDEEGHSARFCPKPLKAKGGKGKG